jgi:hypothetical protein
MPFYGVFLEKSATFASNFKPHQRNGKEKADEAA